ncbi:MAG: ribonuclease P protein component [Candidatus Curtissbacteria bacterium]|nr:ribonuclease P protein component [Candidatus Curtissbacteria bacterium]
MVSFEKMLPSKNRLKLPFGKKLNSSVTKRANNDFTIVLHKNQEVFKAAVVVSKKTAKKAVDRNRIRRITTEAIKELGLKNCELTVIVKNNISEQKTEKVKEALKDLLK